jgi:type IV fimbrial biogenesis protein FimT
MSEMPSKRRNSGYTMMELVMVISIVAILATVGIPSFKYVTTSNRMSGEVNALLGDMQFARSQAIKQGQTVTVCTSTDGANCAGAAVNTWQGGWIVFLDPNGSHTVDAGDTVMRVQPAFTGGDAFVATSTTFSYASFNRLGYGPTGTNGVINITLHDSTSNTAWTRCLAINPIGSVITERYGEQKFGTGTTTCS